MRSPNYYAAPGFERAGLRRREPDWIRARVLDGASVFVPVWRTHNLVIEVEGGEPREIVVGARPRSHYEQAWAQWLTLAQA